MARHVEMEPPCLQALDPWRKTAFSKPGGPDGPLKRHGKQLMAAPSTRRPPGVPHVGILKNKVLIKALLRETSGW